MLIHAFTCDAPGCGVLKGDGEPWLVMLQRHGGPTEIVQWDRNAAMHPNAKHICPNRECLQKMLAIWRAVRN